MKKFLDILKVVAALIPLIKQLIRDVEELIPESGRGAEKLTIVRELLEAAFDALEDVPVVFSEVWPFLERLIGKFVDLLNRIGEFRKS